MYHRQNEAAILTNWYKIAIHITILTLSIAANCKTRLPTQSA